MRVIVAGGGKVGYYLARTLIEHRHTVTVIEKDKHMCAYIANELDTLVIAGDATQIDVLRSANIDKADVFIAVTGKDEDNFIACQLAKHGYHIGKTIARVNNPKNTSVIEQLGVDIAVSSTSIIASMIEKEVDTVGVRLLTSINRGKASISEYTVPIHSPVIAQTLNDIPFPESCIIISVLRSGELIIPRGSTQLFAGDEVIVLTSEDDKDVKKVLGIKH